MISEFKFAVRLLVRTPGFTAVAVLTLALGIGLNTAMFTVVNALLLKPAPYPEPARLVRVYRAATQGQNWPMSLPDLRDLTQQAGVFTAVTPFQWWSYSLSESGRPAEQINGAIAAASLFTTLGVQPSLGRAFTADEQQAGRDNVAVLSDGCWRRRFAADRGVIGKTVRIDGQNVEIIGVMPARADYPMFWGEIDLWRPLPLAQDWRESRDVRWLQAIARLKPDVTRSQAQAEASGIADRLALQYPATNAGQGLRVAPLAGSEIDTVHQRLAWLTLGVAVFVLLIACANLGSLQLARHAARASDFAIRAALGASRPQLIKILLAENLTLALLGGGLGIVGAQVVTTTLAAHLPDGNSAATDFSPDWRVFGFALSAALVAGLLSGALPAWLGTRADLNEALKRQARGSSGDRSSQRLRRALIVTQIAFSLLLLSGSAFFVRGLQRFLDQDPGWKIDRLVKGTITLPESRYPTDEVRHDFHTRVLARLARLPGVESVALATSLPLRDYTTPAAFIPEGHADPVPGKEPLAYNNIVSTDYFSTLGIPLVEGRVFSADSRSDQANQIVINETMARLFWPGESAIGKRVRDTNPVWHPWLEIVGVVRDVAIAGNVGALPTRLQIYHDLAQQPWGYFTVVARGPTPEALTEPLRRAVAELDADLPVIQLRTVANAVAATQRDLQIANTLLAVFAALGVGLAAIGLYGVLAGLVAQRTREFGIRLALGAQRIDVFRIVVQSGLLFAVSGCALGLVLAAGLLQLLSHAFPGIPPPETATIASTVGLLLGVAVIACWLPARRATTVDPVIALRGE